MAIKQCQGEVRSLGRFARAAHRDHIEDSFHDLRVVGTRGLLETRIVNEDRADCVDADALGCGRPSWNWSSV